MELDLKKTISVLFSKIWIIITAMAVSGILFFLTNLLLITPMYTSQTLLYVSNMSERKSSIVTTSDVAVSRDILDTCVVILNSRTVLDKVAEQSGLDYSSKEIKNMISAQSVSNTEVFRITVTHSDPMEAQIIADTILKVAPSEIKRVMNAGAVSVIDYATLPLSPSSPNIPKNTVIGAMLGAMLAVFVILLLQIFDTRVKDEFVLVENFDLPIIGMIPSFKLAEKTVSGTGKKHRRGKRRVS
ncbi:MAG: hypothetical protein IKU65_00395 [Oscillospiraceae bacterium]|nr:hypothetical protein [Oscillospiraceae bacterium]